MREIFTYGSVGRAPGNRCLYPEGDNKGRAATVLPWRCRISSVSRAAALGAGWRSSALTRSARSGAGAPTETSGADEADAPIARDADDFAASRRDDLPVDGKTSVEPEFGDLDIAARVARFRPHE